MTHLFHKLDRILRALPTTTFILAMTSLSYLVTFFVIPIDITLAMLGDPGAGPSSAQSHTLAGALVLFCALGPMIETLVFQWGIIKGCRRLFRWKSTSLIIISASCFGAQHFYSPMYIFNAFAFGILLAYSHVATEENQGSPFWVVSAIHGLRNAVATLLEFYLPHQR